MTLFTLYTTAFLVIVILFILGLLFSTETPENQDYTLEESKELTSSGMTGVTEYVDDPIKSITGEKKRSDSDYVKKTVGAFDRLFSKCLTSQEIFKKYTLSVVPQEVLKSTNVEFLRFYLQHYSRFKNFSWTREQVRNSLSEQIKVDGNKLKMSSDKPRYQNPCTTLITIPPDKVSEPENIDTFATFNIAEDEEVNGTEHTPQKIFFRSYAHKKYLSKNHHERFKKMRAVKDLQNRELSVGGISLSRIDDASLFVAQAKYMQTFEDDYTGHADFQCYYPTYMKMDEEQLRTYFTWRAKVRNGHVEATDISYIFVYIYELLNLIGVASAEEGMRQLLAFWSSYRGYNDKIDRYLERWIKDFYVHYRLSCLYKNILEQFPDGILDKTSVQEEVYRHNYKNKDTYLNLLSSHKYLKSNFYESEYGYTLIECIPYVLDRVDSYLDEQGISFPTLLLGSVVTKDWWSPFNDAVVDVKNPSDTGYSVKINSVEEYSFADGRWRTKHLQTHYHNKLLGYIIKTTEAELRELTGYKRKLQPSIGSITYDDIQNKQVLRIINHTEFTDIIRSVVKAHFANSGIRPQVFKIITQDVEIPIKPVEEVKVDSNKLEAIRSAATETQDRLLIDGNEKEQIQAETEVAIIEEMHTISASTETVQSEVVSHDVEKSTLSKPQHSCISIIISGQNVNSRIAELSMAYGTLPEVLIEGINDLLFEVIGDNVIDFSADVPSIYDDYLDDIKKLIEED